MERGGTGGICAYWVRGRDGGCGAAGGGVGTGELWGCDVLGWAGGDVEYGRGEGYFGVGEGGVG